MHPPVLRRFVYLKGEYKYVKRQVLWEAREINTSNLGGDAIINECYFVMYVKPVQFELGNKYACITSKKISWKTRSYLETEFVTG
jgi:hypothetical protein